MSDGAHCSYDGILSGWEDNGPTQTTLLQTPHHPRGDCIDRGVCEGLIGTPVPGHCQGQDSRGARELSSCSISRTVNCRGLRVSTFSTGDRRKLIFVCTRRLYQASPLAERTRMWLFKNTTLVLATVRASQRLPEPPQVPPPCSGSRMLWLPLTLC